MSDRTTDRPRLRYRFVGGLVPERPAEEAARLKLRLTSAVRALYGLRGAVGWELASGPTPSLDLVSESPLTRRWIGRTLLPCYRPQEWRAVTVAGPAGPAALFAAHRSCLPGESSEPVPDPGSVLRTLVAAFAGSPPGLRLGLVATPRRLPRGLPGWLRVAGGVPMRSRAGTVGARGSGEPLVRRAPMPSAVTVPPLVWDAELRLWVGAAPALGQAPSMVEAAFRSLDGAGVRLRPTRLHHGRAPRFLLSEPELVSLLPTWESSGLGDGAAAAPSPVLPIGRLLGGAAAGLSVPTDEGRHLAVLGETGMGKSSLLVAYARRAARCGTVVLLDPLGETATAVRDVLARDGRSVRWISPSIASGGLNALGAAGSEDTLGSERRIDDLVRALQRVRARRFTDRTFWGPRLAEVLGRALRAAARCPGGTMEDAYRLLLSAENGSRPSAAAMEPGARELLLRLRERPDDADGARRLLFEVVGNPTLRSALCARPPAFTAAELLRPRSVTVISGAAAEVGETAAQYLLSVYLAILWSELLARTAREKTFVLLDEVQWYGHESLAEMLRLGRRCNAHVVLATQSYASLTDEVREAAETNVADTVVFRGAPSAARDLARLFPRLHPEDLLALPRGSALLLEGKGEGVRWIRTARTPGPEAGPQPVRSTETAPPVAGDASTTREAETDTIERVWASLRRDASTIGPGGVLEIRVGELARGGPQGGDDRLWREVGSRLGRLGALLASHGNGVARTWRVDASRLLQGSEPPARPFPEESSTVEDADTVPNSSLRGPGSR